MPETRVGGSFAPPLPPLKLVEYKALAESADPPVRDAMLTLARACEAYHAHPHPKKGRGEPHPSGAGQIHPLAADAREALDQHIPWEHELDAVQALFDRLPADSPLRTPCFHLLWFARELCLDRHPITTDVLGEK